MSEGEIWYRDIRIAAHTFVRDGRKNRNGDEIGTIEIVLPDGRRPVFAKAIRGGGRIRVHGFVGKRDRHKRIWPATVVIVSATRNTVWRFASHETMPPDAGLRYDPAKHDELTAVDIWTEVQQEP